MKKATVIHALNELPKEFNLELLDRLILIEKIDAGLAESKSGKTIRHEQLKKMVAKWQK
jgi:predicted transcriptional regulator